MQKFDISLNLKKSFFVMKEGKLLGHIISQEGIKIYLKRVEEIHKIEPPRNKVKAQSFLGKVNFLRRFISCFTVIVRCITNMQGKDREIKWKLEVK